MTVSIHCVFLTECLWWAMYDEKVNKVHDFGGWEA